MPRVPVKTFILRLCGVVATSVLCNALPAVAAENLVVTFGPIERRIAVADLEAFAEKGELQNEAGFVLQRFSPEQQQKAQQALIGKLEGIDPIVLSQFTYTRPGEQLLTEVGELIRTESGQNGFQSLRAAMLLTATSPDGVTPLNFLKNLPTDMRIDLAALLSQGQRVRQFLQETDTAVSAIETQAKTSTPGIPLSLEALPDPRAEGSTSFTKQTIQFYDARRDRTLLTDLYLPEGAGPIPVILVSNGLGARRTRFADLGAHLASHGFAVVIPDHPGSDRQRLQDFNAGLYRENFDSADFIERPHDLSFLLDELQRQGYGDRLNLSQVGVFGYSFGGVTALSLAGATIDPVHLQRDCDTRSAIFNISLLYQCRALELSPEQLAMPLADERVTAIYLFFPFGRSLFGPDGMAKVQIPLFWQATDLDILTPLLEEHLPTYGWITAEDRYLAISRGLPHARLTLDVLRQLTPIPDEWPRLRDVTQTYQEAMAIAFFETYIREDERYRTLLQQDYTQVLTEEPYRFSLVRSLPQ
ncbi:MULTISPECIES: alpha/beta hydrolase [unclassified Leptolyngbya]|uniref:alpha/beta hydrolase n=1 Tax=unclassified Leptolyngbya TaxID=2650499 RepID=UPI001689EB4C|nr:MULTISPECIES: alpha/beta hydrolase [unclassified Leptolyngbya]MBD1913887.1 alpha/beta hydrolase [Leptolyngbya sp. FACHB-8]MBD2156339.1 alpha/beta hydrolase [Leptolyngbya sp. FACHB-16]